ncbi:hypothetical protein [Halobacillus amylolyticus]|uniref:Phage protein n=1 Tax=Halobacillus amylolyticus TaxID=2932259 RepID=A0ABY4H7S6_9BACI|nr:hypothetical protein [Halobacillus amylolyticus]UOR10654.1 hypothetical protein MUO15_13420 [Halobacillus amylolyticus]
MANELKFTTDELFDIIHKFFQDKKHLGEKMTFSSLARYADKELHIQGIKYYHFSRKKEISDKVREYNESLQEESIEYAADNSYFATLDVKEFIKSNGSNPDRLAFYLNNLQVMHKKLYDRTIDAEFKVKELEVKLADAIETKDKYKKKNKNLKLDANKMKEEIKAYKEALDIKEERQLIDALNSTELYVIENSEDELVNNSQESIKELDETNGKNIEKLLEQYDDIFD